jgi:hypothetical protein
VVDISFLTSRRKKFRTPSIGISARMGPGIGTESGQVTSRAKSGDKSGDKAKIPPRPLAALPVIVLFSLDFMAPAVGIEPTTN